MLAPRFLEDCAHARQVCSRSCAPPRLRCHDVRYAAPVRGRLRRRCDWPRRVAGANLRDIHEHVSRRAMCSSRVLPSRPHRLPHCPSGHGRQSACSFPASTIYMSEALVSSRSPGMERCGLDACDGCCSRAGSTYRRSQAAPPYVKANGETVPRYAGVSYISPLPRCAQSTSTTCQRAPLRCSMPMYCCVSCVVPSSPTPKALGGRPCCQAPQVLCPREPDAHPPSNRAVSRSGGSWRLQETLSCEAAPPPLQHVRTTRIV